MGYMPGWQQPFVKIAMLKPPEPVILYHAHSFDRRALLPFFCTVGAGPAKMEPENLC